MVQEDNIFGILKTCYATNSKSGEQFIKSHGLSYIIAGEMEAYDGHAKHIYKKGDVVLYRKNALIRFVKYPLKEQAFEAISIILDDNVLQNFSQEYQLLSNQKVKGSLFKLQEDSLITSSFIALKSWFAQDISQELATLKKNEFIHLLLRHNPSFKDVLFQFAPPGKINLEAFMNTHYRFNVPLSEFSFLTGRSLATFKRDFEKIFGISPNRWLQQKRLEEAYYLLHNKKMKSKEVYLEVGFESLSHFSRAFKDKFGLNPSSI